MSENACPCGKDAKTCPAAKTTTATAQNGKGDAPRNISTKFRKNYEAISWQFDSKKKKKTTGKKFVKVY